MTGLLSNWTKLVGFVHQKCSHQQKVLVWESHMSCSANEERWIFNWRHRSTWSFCRKSMVTTNIDIISILRSILKALCQHLGFQWQILSGTKLAEVSPSLIATIQMTTVFNPSSLLAAERDSRVQVVAYSVQVQCLQSLQTLINQSLSQTWW